MKTTLLALAATLFASSAAFANDGLFDVNDAPANYEIRQAQMLDFEPVATTSVSYGDVQVNYDPTDNDALYDG